MQTTITTQQPFATTTSIVAPFPMCSAAPARKATAIRFAQGQPLLPALQPGGSTYLVIHGEVLIVRSCMWGLFVR